MHPRARSDLHHVVRFADHLQVVLDHQDRVAQVAQLAQDPDQAPGVALMQPDRRLVEDVEHAGQAGSEQRRQPQPLGLAGRDRRRRALERQVADPDVDHPADALAQIVQNRRQHRPGFGRDVPAQARPATRRVR